MNATILLFCMPFLRLLHIPVVGVFTIFSCQMGVGLHGRHDTCVSQPFLHKFPVYWFAILQVGTDESRSVCVPQNVWMQDHSRFPGVMLEDLLYCGYAKRSPVG